MSNTWLPKYRKIQMIKPLVRRIAFYIYNFALYRMSEKVQTFWPPNFTCRVHIHAQSPSQCPWLLMQQIGNKRL